MFATMSPRKDDVVRRLAVGLTKGKEKREKKEKEINKKEKKRERDKKKNDSTGLT